MAAESTLAECVGSRTPMLNLPPQPGTTGRSACASAPSRDPARLRPVGRRRSSASTTGCSPSGRHGGSRDHGRRSAVHALARRPGHPRDGAGRARAREYVGAETKLIDGEVVERIGADDPGRGDVLRCRRPGCVLRDPRGLGLWLGYALVPRRPDTRSAGGGLDRHVGGDPRRARPRAGTPRLVGRNRLSEREPVYLSRAAESVTRDLAALALANAA